jgi:hypothetical protein
MNRKGTSAPRAFDWRFGMYASPDYGVPNTSSLRSTRHSGDDITVFIFVFEVDN